MKGFPILITGLILLRSASLSPAAAGRIVAEPPSMASVSADVHAAFESVLIRRTARLKQRTQVFELLTRTPVHAAKRGTTILPIVDKPDIRQSHKEIISSVLTQLPLTCLSNLKYVYVRYDNPDNRGLAGKNSMILDGNVPDDEFAALVVHEYAHTIDVGCMTGTATSGSSPYKDGGHEIYNDDPSLGFYNIAWKNNDDHKAGIVKEDFVSGYAAWDPFEDFAETFAYYVLQPDAFRMRATRNEILAQKYNWMNRMVFRGHPPLAEGKHDGTDVPWDVTRLPYAWLTNNLGQ